MKRDEIKNRISEIEAELATLRKDLDKEEKQPTFTLVEMMSGTGGSGVFNTVNSTMVGRMIVETNGNGVVAFYVNPGRQRIEPISLSAWECDRFVKTNETFSVKIETKE